MKPCERIPRLRRGSSVPIKGNRSQFNAAAMKNIYIILLFLFFSGKTFSQIYYPIVEEGKVWSTYHNFYTGSGFSEFTKFEGDTLINGKTYLKVWKTSDTTLSAWTYDGQIREDGYGVYYGYAYSSDELLIYTFHVAPGDTIYLRDSNIPFVLDSTGMTILLNGETRPVYYFSSPGFNCTETWIEGVGSNRGILNGGYCGMVGDDPEMICFTEDDVLKYKNENYENCYVLTGINDPKRTAIILFPNPTSGSFTIKLWEQPILPMTMEFFDQAGKVNRTLIIPAGVNTFTLQPPSSRGIYFFRLMDVDGIKASGKLVVY